LNVIVELIGMSGVRLSRFNRWSDGILKTNYTRSGAESPAAVCSRSA
jgi:hypothetical protein